MFLLVLWGGGGEEVDYSVGPETLCWKERESAISGSLSQIRILIWIQIPILTGIQIWILSLIWILI